MIVSLASYMLHEVLVRTSRSVFVKFETSGCRECAFEQGGLSMQSDSYDKMSLLPAKRSN